MSGVFGCWRLDTRPVDPGLVRRCAAQLMPEGEGDLHSWLDSSIGLACKFSPSAPQQDAAANRAGIIRAVCVFDGRLDNRGEIVRCLSPHFAVSSQSPDRDLVVAAYHAFGDQFVEHIQGDFCLAIFDRQEERLLLARDRLGLRPLCYTHAGGAFLFASAVKALLPYPGVASRPDETMLADFVLYFRVEDSLRRTFFDGIHSLPPAHLLIATRAGVTIRRYFDFDTTAQIRLPGITDYAAAFHERFVASVRARLRSSRPVAISVSGGLDSAYIYCVAQQAMRDGPAQCPSVHGFNNAGVPGTQSEEDRFVAALEQATSTAIDRIPQRVGFLRCAEDEAWHAESPIVEGLACQGQAMFRRVAASGAGRLLTGHWGDQLLSDSDYLVDLLCRGRFASLARHARAWRIGAGGVAAGLARDVASRRAARPVAGLVRAARARRRAVSESPWFTARFQRLLRARAAQPGLFRPRGSSHASAIYRQSRLGYHVQCMEWNSRMGTMHNLDVAFPYLDCELIQFLIGIPGEVMSHDGPRGLMRRAMRGIVPDAVTDRCSKGEFTRLTNESVVTDFERITELLGRSALSVRMGYIDGPVLWKLLPEWRAHISRADDAVVTNRLVDLCGVELLLRGFFGNAEGAPTQSRNAAVSC
jgi:asparagine synthase (glutamine-hydrolysing)